FLRRPPAAPSETAYAPRLRWFARAWSECPPAGTVTWTLAQRVALRRPSPPAAEWSGSRETTHPSRKAGIRSAWAGFRDLHVARRPLHQQSSTTTLQARRVARARRVHSAHGSTLWRRFHSRRPREERTSADPAHRLE